MDFPYLGQGELEAHHLPRREGAEVKHELVLEHALSLSLVLGVDVNLGLHDGHQTGGEHLRTGRPRLLFTRPNVCI